MWASAPASVTSTTRPRIERKRYALSGSEIARATTRRSRMFRSLTRPRAELIRTWLPSQSNQTGVTWGVPSGMIVPRLAKAFFPSRRSANCSSVMAMNSLLCSACGGARLRGRRPGQRWRSRRGRAQGAVQSLFEVGHVLQADGQPDEDGADAELHALLLGQQSMGRPGRIGPG